ncbi:MAG: DUF4920 domain-containing protein [Balneolaceae bacterium]|nr:MAG: DUF4920 domain-containing protein [Balneolaceae bacterium]
MKQPYNRILICFFLFSLLPMQFLFAQNEVIALSDPIISTDQYNVYGSKMDETYSLTDLSVMDSSEFDAENRQESYFAGVLTEVCQTRGCNFYLDTGERQIRVRFLDYGFFVPTDSTGKNTVVRGGFVQKADEETGEPYFELLSSAIKIYKPL